MMRRPVQGLGWRTVLSACAAALALTGCGPTRLNVKPDIPPLLMTPMPLAMGVRIPKSFAEYVQKESAQDHQWEINLGAGQADAIRRVTSAMFEHTLVLGDQASGDEAAIAGHKLNAILETTLDSYVYLLPTPGASEYYSATIGYKVNLLSVEGKVLGSWIYEGYGSAPARGLGSAKGVELVTGLAIRDACANLAVHLPDQELVRDLLAPAAPAVSAPTPDSAQSPVVPPATEAAPKAAAAPSTQPAPNADATPNAATAPATEAAPNTQAAPNTVTAPATEAAPSTTITPNADAPRPEPAPALPATPTAPETSPTPSAVQGQPATGN
jgi:hypothetical protein